MKFLLRLFVYLSILVPVVTLAIVLEIGGESMGGLRNVLLPLVATGLCLQQSAGVIASVFIGIGLAGEACGSLPFGASAVASAMSGLVCLNLLQQRRLPWIWRGALTVVCVSGLQNLIGEMATAIRSSEGVAVFSAFQQAVQYAAVAGAIWLLTAIVIAGFSTAFSLSANRRTGIELR